MRRTRRLIALVLLCVLALPAQALVVLSYHDIRDDVAAKGDPDPYAVSTGNFVAHLDWLRGQGYLPVSVQQILDARQQGSPLPEKAVLLTFDDGLRSVYTHVFPLLRAYGYPALVAPVTGWVEMPPGRTVDYRPKVIDAQGFLTWAQLKEMQDSGLVEIGSHSHALHRGVPGNPQGNLTPAAVTREYRQDGYETERDYLQRLRLDLDTSRSELLTHLGHAPRVMVWPYAAYNSQSNAIASRLGMPLSFDLEGRSDENDLALQGRRAVNEDTLASLGRLLLFNNPDVGDLARELRRDLSLDGMRALQVDLDQVYDADPAQTERNLDRLVQRVRDIGPTHVFLQAFADPDGDGAADAVYFPTVICQCGQISSTAQRGSCGRGRACGCMPGCRYSVGSRRQLRCPPTRGFSPAILPRFPAWIRRVRTYWRWPATCMKTWRRTRGLTGCSSMTMPTCATTNCRSLRRAVRVRVRSCWSISPTS